MVSFAIKKHLLNKMGERQRLKSKCKCYGDAAKCYTVCIKCWIQCVEYKTTRIHTASASNSTTTLVACLVNFFASLKYYGCVLDAWFERTAAALLCSAQFDQTFCRLYFNEPYKMTQWQFQYSDPATQRTETLKNEWTKWEYAVLRDILLCDFYLYSLHWLS